MRTYREPSKVVHYAALMLGQSALVIGFWLVLVYAVGAALMVGPHGRGSGLLLSPIPPLFGLGCGGLALFLVWRQGSRAIGAATAGLVLNALALALAVWLLNQS